VAKPSSVDDAARQQLLARVASMQRAAPQRSRNYDEFLRYSNLPGYDDLKVQFEIGAALGIDNPFFRMHDARADHRSVIGGHPVLNFSSYDYLGLNGHPEVIAACHEAISRFGISCGASRHVAGERQIHRDLELALANHYGVEDACVFVSGYATNLGVIGQMLGPKDLMIHDAVMHNSAIMGAELAGCTRLSFKHNDLDDLDGLLTKVRSQYERVMIVVEGLYGMDGDFPDLVRLVEIKKRHQAWLMVDEAHALGVLGKTGRGLAERFGVAGTDVDIWMGTLSKTLASCGGYIAATAELILYLKNTAGVFVFSVGMPPVIATAAWKSLEIMHREPERVMQLQENARYFLERARAAGLDTGTGAGTAVCPIIIGDSMKVVVLSQRLLQRGVNVQPVMYPSVPAKASRLRFFLTQTHTQHDIDQGLAILSEEIDNLGATMKAMKIPGY
jgi:8-amino-7-oxononanoate synthase